MKNILLFLLIILTTSCTRSRLKKEIEQLYSAEIQIPSQLTRIQNGAVLSLVSNKKESAAKLLIYYSPQGCTACKVGHISDLDTLFNMAIRPDLFTPEIIIAPDTEKYDDVVNQLKYQRHPYSVYVDKYNDFQRLNSFLPDNQSSFSFLLDKNDRIVLVGNPLTSNAMWALFKSTLDNMLSHDGVYVPE